MGDADDSYDFGELPKFVEQLRRGFDVVQGCRLPSGGGRVLPGAMPLLHRWWGNPMFSMLARTMFGADVHDINCGMRGFSKAAYERLALQCPGMEFATEMIVKASRQRLRIAEVPITLHPDGRRAHGPHLRTFRDGWRTLRYYLMCSPRWMFFVPALFFACVAVLGYALALPAARIGGVRFDIHTLLVSSASLLVAHQAAASGIFAKVAAVRNGFVAEDRWLERFFDVFDLEVGLLVGGGLAAAGTVLVAKAFTLWRAAHFGDLAVGPAMRIVVPGITLVVLGAQTLFSSFVLGMLRPRAER
jgi:hypothetical protein